MSLVLYNLIQDPELPRTYFVIDAIERLSGDIDVNLTAPPSYTDTGKPGSMEVTPNEQALRDILVLISTTIQLSDKVRWMLSLDTESCDATLAAVDKSMQLHLTINSATPHVRKIALEHAASKVAATADSVSYSGTLREAVVQKLQEVPSGNFLWLDMALDVVKSSTHHAAQERPGYS
ncbi:hypothetical protein J3459_011947 [Metarhizium acridum]|nr:hypothetical protein J3459_011947 [Metarhizium acridum]